MPRLLPFAVLLLLGVGYQAMLAPSPPDAPAVAAPDPLFSGLHLPPEATPAVERFQEQEGARRAAFRARLDQILDPAQRRHLEDRRWTGTRGDFRDLNPTEDQEARIRALLAEERPRAEALVRRLLADLKPFLEPQELLTLEERLRSRWGRPRSSATLSPMILVRR